MDVLYPQTCALRSRVLGAQGIQLVDGSVRGVVSSTETSFTNVATLVAYGVTAAVHDPSQFHILVIIGLAGVSSKKLPCLPPRDFHATPFLHSAELALAPLNPNP